MDAPYSIRPIDELKRVFPILFSHFLWRRGFRWEARANTDVADIPNHFSLAGLGVEKKDGKVQPLITEESVFWSMV